MQRMQLRQLGLSNLKVSPVIFGAWAIGGWMWGGTEEKKSIDAIRASLDNGVNTIDTAAIYGMGHSEEIVAKAVEGRRDSVVIATKCGMRWDSAAGGDQGSDPWPQKDNDGKSVVIRKNSRPESIFHECEQSLRRLRTDYIDLYQIHWPDVSTPLEESMAAMAKLKDQGKIRAIGMSNYNVEWLENAQTLLRHVPGGPFPLASDQPPYSVIQRNIEKDVLPWCLEHQIGVIVYSPLERGLLTGKVGPDREFAPGDHRAAHKLFTVENRKRVLAELEKIKPIADRHNASYAQTIINWTIHVPGVTAALVGARNAKQAEHNAKAMTFTLSEEERKQIRAVFDPNANTV